MAHVLEQKIARAVVQDSKVGHSFTVKITFRMTFNIVISHLFTAC